MRRLYFKTGLLQFKIIISFLLIIVIISASLTVLYLIYLKNVFERELINKYTGSLEQLQDNVDRYILESAQNVVTHYLNLDPDIKKLFYVPVENNHIYIKRTWEQISKIVNPSDFYHGIYIYYKLNNMVIGNTGTYLLHGKTTNKYDFSWMIENGRTLDTWVYISDFGKYNPEYKSKSILAYVRQFPLNSGETDGMGVFAVTIDIDRAYDRIRKLSMSVFENMSMIDEKSNIIYMKGLKDFDLANFINNIATEESGFYKLKHHKKGRVVFYRRSELGGFYYISTVDLLPELIQKLFVNEKIYVIAFAEVLLLVILSVLWSRRLYDPIGSLVARIRTINKEVLGHEINTYKEEQMLNTTMQKLVEKVQELQSKVVFDEPEIKNSFLKQLFYSTNTNSDRQNINTLLKRLKVEFPFAIYQCLYIKIMNCENIERVKMETTRYNLIYFIENIHVNDCVKFATVVYDGCIGVLVNSGRKETVIKLAKDIAEYEKSDSQVSLCIGVGECKQELIQVWESFRSAVDVTLYSFIYPEQKVLVAEVIAKEHVKPYVDIGIRKEMSKLLEYNLDTQKVSSYIEYILWAIKKEKYTVDSVFKYVNEIINAINEKFTFYRTDELIDLNRINNINDARSIILASIERLKTIIDEEESNKTVKEIERIKKYIREQICRNSSEDISLVCVSEKFNKSPNYLSKIFKDITGVSFKEFVIDVKLEKAIEIINENKNIKTSELAYRLGYTNISHFIRIFRGKYGCTPQQYISGL